MSKEVFEKIISGDRKTFEHVFKRYFKGMYFYALNFGLDKDTSREVVQSTFVKIWERRQYLSPHSEFENYLFASLRNNCLLSLREKKNKLELEELRENDKNLIQQEENTFESISQFNELSKTYHSSLAEMPDQMRKVFIMSREGGLTYKEIGRKLNITVNTVETHIRRALKKLKNDLKDFLPILLFLLNI
ncbi:RNA polymerase sigma-70 factor [Prolixibacteraceae bacterium JC049]|nr:RNA polymerase sigma-70 factor [Prolixibacteraceae bacterium JC049]